MALDFFEKVFEMYSARDLNAAFYGVSNNDPFSPTPIVDALPAREVVLPGIGGVLSNRAGDFELEGRDAWLFISIKNRSFDRGYIDRFIGLCEAAGISGHICPVDRPYHYNRMAELGLDELPAEEADKIERLSSDLLRMAQKAVNGSRTKRVDLLRWSDLEAETPPIYRAELTAAFKAGKLIRRVIHDQVASVKRLEDERTFERFAEFFLCEVPVLINAYYSKGPSLDVYPGPHPQLFWKIELGVFEEELPELTALTRCTRSMLYLDTHSRRKVKP